MRGGNNHAMHLIRHVELTRRTNLTLTLHEESEEPRNQIQKWGNQSKNQNCNARERRISKLHSLLYKRKTERKTKLYQSSLNKTWLRAVV